MTSYTMININYYIEKEFFVGMDQDYHPSDRDIGPEISDIDGENDEEKPQPVKKVSRKRQRQPQLHKKSIAKENVERGRERATLKKIIPAKIFQGQTLCKCKPLCSSKIDITRQNTIFNSYWNIANHSQKIALIRNSVDVRPVRPKSDQFLPLIPKKNRKVTFQYHLADSNGIPHKVCRDFLQNCYQISSSTLNRFVTSTTSNPSGEERRGKSSSANRTSDEARNIVRAFINKFPAYESHYGRSSSQKKYLHMDLSVAAMYRMYLKQFEDVQHKKPVSENIFREIFNHDFNLSFKKRHSDTCNACNTFKANKDNQNLSEEERRTLTESKEAHDALREQIFKEFKQNVNQTSEDTIVLTFDLQKVLDTPSLSDNVAYYKRQLATYNLCIVDEKTHKAYMYVWSENVASRGAQEIGSCILRHLRTSIPEDVQFVKLYSDCCGGQNRNIKLSLMLKHFLASSDLKLIEHNFFLSGHSYNSCDRNFGLIERERKKFDDIETPEKWIQIIQNSKVKEPKFQVTKMEKEHFFTSKELESMIVNRKTDVFKQKINWLKIRQIRHDKEKLFDLCLKHDNDQELRCVNIARKGVSEEQFQNYEVSLLYPTGNVITQQKYDDLMALIKLIDPKYRPFYIKLRTTNENKDYDFASGDSDDE
ncbi:uncharacterized protein LOC115886267 [Sitophilus oryzae]|uniref:Uncharacterized protein LOC115886267 n=1 Tax=Sitophilus oryzae TaxID=7048 RepID=A0A6J2YEB0_SITOR|nr:uncharacterized protein LOC115886267 [Sitophilus oryzae]